MRSPAELSSGPAFTPGSSGATVNPLQPRSRGFFSESPRNGAGHGMVRIWSNPAFTPGLKHTGRAGSFQTASATVNHSR